MELLWIFIAFFASVFLGVPIVAAIALTTLLGYVLLDVPFLAFITRTFGGIDSTPLLALPFYVLAGELMYRGRIIEMLIRFVDGLIGWVRGGFAYVNVLVSMIFSGTSGSTVSDTAAVGSVMIPAMIRKGYDPDFAVAVTVASSTMAPLKSWDRADYRGCASARARVVTGGSALRRGLEIDRSWTQPRQSDCGCVSFGSLREEPARLA